MLWYQQQQGYNLRVIRGLSGELVPLLAIPFALCGGIAMVAVRVSKAKREASLLASLDSMLAEHGASLDSHTGLKIDREASTADIESIGRVLISASKDTTRGINLGLGAWWVVSDGGKYGERTKMLEKLVGWKAANAWRKRLSNYACVWRRWNGYDTSKKVWSYLRTHRPGVNGGSPVRCVTSASAKTAVYETSLRAHRLGTVEAIEAWHAACEAVEHPELDTFAGREA